METLPKDQIAPPAGWCLPDNIRIEPLPRKKASLISRIILLGTEKIGKFKFPNLMLMMSHNPRLLRGMIFFVSKLMPYGELDRQDTELVILRVAWNCRSHYEWGQHVSIGMDTGLSIDDIYRITQGPDAQGWSKQQATLLKACDEFHKDRFVSDNTWQILASYFDKRILLELLFLIGFYDGFAGVLNSSGLPLDAEMKNKLSLLKKND
jgi:alkylhydroperoxidase family enzyme